MTRLTKIAATALAVAATGPAVALAADAELRGQPTLEHRSAQTAELRFAVDDALPRKAGGGIDATAQLAGQARASLRLDGRHGDDPIYAGVVRSQRPLTIGRKYTVKITVKGMDEPIVRLVKLKAAR